MNIQQILFWILSIITLACALGVVVARNPVHSVLSLIATFFAIAGIYVTLNAQFLAIVNIIVYAGAIMVLFLFVLMMMNLNASHVPRKHNMIRFMGVISGGLLFIILVAVIHKTSTGVMTSGSTDIGLIENLGRTLFDHFVLPFEISSFLFLSAMIGAIVIGKKE